VKAFGGGKFPSPLLSLCSIVERSFVSQVGHYLHSSDTSFFFLCHCKSAGTSVFPRCRRESPLPLVLVFFYDKTPEGALRLSKPLSLWENSLPPTKPPQFKLKIDRGVSLSPFAFLSLLLIRRGPLLFFPFSSLGGSADGLSTRLCRAFSALLLSGTSFLCQLRRTEETFPFTPLPPCFSPAPSDVERP